MASVTLLRQPPPTRTRSLSVKHLPPSHLLLGLLGGLGITFLGGLGAYLGVCAGGGHWTGALAGGLFGLGAVAGLGAGLLLLLSPDADGNTPTPAPTDDLWLTDHERWDRLFDRLARSSRVPVPAKRPRQRPKSRPPMAR